MKISNEKHQNNLLKKDNISFTSKISESLKKCDNLSSSKIINGDLLFDCLIRIPQISENFSNFINNIPALHKISNKLFEKNPFALINEVPNEFLSETLRREKKRDFIELTRKIKKKINRKKMSQKLSSHKIENVVLHVKKWKEASKSIIISMKEAFFILLEKLKDITKSWEDLKERVLRLMAFKFYSNTNVKKRLLVKEGGN